MKNLKNIISSIIIQSVALAAPVSVLAQAESNPGDSPLTGGIVPSKIEPVNDIIKVVGAAIQFILIIAFILAFIFLLIGGIRWIIAGGDEKGVAAARGMITSALIGLVIVLVAYAIILLIENFFNVSIISEGVTVPTINN